MRFSIRDLLWLTVVVALVGCRDRKMERIRQGVRDVEKHAKDIEQAAGSPDEQAQGANPPGN
jgi:hypothetical protein